MPRPIDTRPDSLAATASARFADDAPMVARDSSRGVADSCLAPDRIAGGMTDRWLLDGETRRGTDAAAVFGDESQLVAGETFVGVASEDETFAGDMFTVATEQSVPETAAGEEGVWAAAAVNLLVIGVVSVYMFCIYRYFDDVMALFRSVFRRNVMSSGRVVERRRSEIFYGFLGKLFLLGAAFVGVLASEAALRRGEFAELNIFYVPLAAVGVFLAVVVAQYVMLAGVGLVTRSFADVATLVRIRLVYFALATVMVAPAMLVAQISAGTAAEAWFAAGCLSAAVAAFFFLRESLMLFISKKISILHWFLYLCTIEIMPLSFLWRAAIGLRQ